MNRTNMPDTSHYSKCFTMKLRHENSHRIRSLILLILSAANGYFHIIGLPITKGIEVTPDTNYARNAIFTMGFVYALAAFFCLAAVVVLGLLLRQDKGMLLLIPVTISVVCVLTGLFQPILGILTALVLAYGLYESRDAVWLKNQEGYPYFNERFAEQSTRFGKEYESDYDIRSQAATSEMPDLGSARDPFNSEDGTMTGGSNE